MYSNIPTVFIKDEVDSMASCRLYCIVDKKCGGVKLLVDC